MDILNSVHFTSPAFQTVEPGRGLIKRYEHAPWFGSKPTSGQ
jgi:hypothetical protein